MPLLHHQPFKLVYLVYYVAKTLFVKIPIWILISIPRSQRPRRNWSIGRCLRIYMLRTVMQLPVKLNLKVKRDLRVEVPDSKLRDARFAWVEAIDGESLSGEVRDFAKTAGVNTARIPGYWQFKPGKTLTGALQAQDGEKIVYHIHGGAMYLGSAHPSDMTARIPRGILKHSAAISRTFAVDYRLSSSAPYPAENPFPAALLDCISGYQHLIELGFQPENITVAGDSAGGNLALALVRYLARHPSPDVAPPGRLLLLSPWGDLSSSRLGPTSSLVLNAKSDMFPVLPPTKGGVGSYGATSYLGAMDRKELETNPYISPASLYIVHTDGMFKGFPRTYILAGGAERILDDSKAIAERMVTDNDSDAWVTLDVEEDGIHDFIVLPWFEPEGSKALMRIAGWIDRA
ncbi:alpha/beta-hydrolase [Ramaria rubella]|nr:alpha/beta-hydrolase [Ramaria rubella]